MVLAPRVSSPVVRPETLRRVSFARIPEVLPMPNLIDIQRRSFQWFLDEGLGELLAEISPIQDFTGQNMDLDLAVPGPNGDPRYSSADPKYCEKESSDTDATTAAPMRRPMRLPING